MWVARMTVWGASFLALGLGQESARNLAGNWRSVQTSRGDGSVNCSPGAIVPGWFRLDGKSLILTVDEGDGTQSEQVMTIAAISPSSLEIAHGRNSVNGQQIRYSLPGQAAIEGALRWEGDALVLPKARGEWKLKRH
jgi:hypothetical protein